LEIINGFDTDNIFVIKDCLRALRAMSVEIAAGGIELVVRLLDIEKTGRSDWYFVGEEAAKLMAKFVEGECIEEAFSVAELLLEVRVKTEKDWAKATHGWRFWKVRGGDGFFCCIFLFFRGLCFGLFVLRNGWQVGCLCGILLVGVVVTRLNLPVGNRRDDDCQPLKVLKSTKFRLNNASVISSD
jgi:hypothetical protein